MKLTQPEIISIIRRRKGLKQYELGEKCWPELKAAYIKMKKIESGTQLPTETDLEAIAKNLGISVEELDESYYETMIEAKMLRRVEERMVQKMDENCFCKEALTQCPMLEHYVRIINSASKIGDPNFLAAAIKSLCTLEPAIERRVS